MIPEEFDKKRKIELNESTYYNTKGRDGESNLNGPNYFS